MTNHAGQTPTNHGSTGIGRAAGPSVPGPPRDGGPTDEAAVNRDSGANPAAQQLSAEIRRLRLAAGLTQAQLASTIGYSRPHISMVENPIQGITSKKLIQAIDNALNANGALISLANQVTATKKQRRKKFTKQDQSTDEPEAAVAALQRQLNTIEMTLREWSTRAGQKGLETGHLDGSVSGSRNAADAPADIRPARLPARLSTVSTAHLDELLAHLRDQWHALVRADNLLGPRFALAGVRDQMVVIEELLPGVAGLQRHELVTLAATYAESAAWLHEDAGQMAAAAYWVGRAMEWAHEVGDQQLLAWTLFRCSQHAAARRDAQGVVNLTSAAFRTTDDLPNPMRAAILQQQANGHALGGDEVKAHRTFDLAHQWAAMDSAGDARGGHGSFCSAPYIELQRAHSWTLLGKPHRAVSAYEKTLPSLPAIYRRDHGLACGRLAHAYVAVQQVEAAAQASMEAWSIAQSSGSARIEREVIDASEKLAKYRHLSVVKQLFDDLSATTTR